MPIRTSYPHRVALVTQPAEIDQIGGLVADGTIDSSSVAFDANHETVTLTVWRITPDVHYRRLVWPLAIGDEASAQSLLRIHCVADSSIPHIGLPYPIITNVRYEPDDGLLVLELAGTPPVVLRVNNLRIELEDIGPPTLSGPTKYQCLKLHWGRLGK